MNPSAIIGLDTSQAGVCYHLQNRAGNTLATGTAAKTQAGWAQLNQVLASHSLEPRDCLVAIEATGTHHLPWCEAFTAAGAVVLALNPLIGKRTTPVRNAIRDYKSDPIDAEGLARAAERDGAALTRFTYHSDPPGFGLRTLLAARRAVRTALTNIKKHTGALQELLFPSLRALELPDSRAATFWEKAPTPALMAQLGASELNRIAGVHARAVRRATTQAFTAPALAQAAVPTLQTLLATQQSLVGQLKNLDRQIAEQCLVAIPEAQLALARTLPGFGAITTPMVLAAIPPDLWTRVQPRKRKAACLQALFGLDPRLRQSGKWTGKTKLSKRGDPGARCALYQIAFCSLTHDPQMRAYYQRLRTVKKKSHKAALIDLTRKHLRRLVAVIESGKEYQPQGASAAA